jgi:hypothetical protein
MGTGDVIRKKQANIITAYRGIILLDNPCDKRFFCEKRQRLGGFIQVMEALA